MKYIILISLLLFSCRDVSVVEKPRPVTDFRAFMEKGSPYIKDESLDLFLKKPWYTYDESNHIIWPNFQVYALKSRGRYYKVQIIDYYQGTLPGHPTLRIEERRQSSYEVSFEAQGCGNVYTNLDFKECIKDPETNIYTYFNIRNQSSWKMSDQEAKENNDWDIALNGTEVKINSGINGPGDVRIAPLYLYGSFFDGEIADFQALAEVSFSDKGERFFNLNYDLPRATYSLPPGVERVVDERFWLKSEEGVFSSNPDFWWVLKGESGYYKFNVKSIREDVDTRETLSTLTLSFHRQLPNESQFSKERFEWSLPPISSRKRVIRWCLNFKKREVVDCRQDQWDLRFGALQRRGTRKWQFLVNLGAIGPLNTEDASSWTVAPL